MLKELGLSDHEAKNPLRFSLGRGTTADGVDRAVEEVVEGVARAGRNTCTSCSVE